MDNHEIGILTFVFLGLALMFLPTAMRFRRRNSQHGKATIPKPKDWQIWLAGLAFFQAIAFAATGLACEAAGTHWTVGLFCVGASLSCSALVLFLFGLRPRHFLR